MMNKKTHFKNIIYTEYNFNVHFKYNNITLKLVLVIINVKIKVIGLVWYEVYCIICIER